MVYHFNLRPNIPEKIDEGYLQTLTYCNMNCGNPILLDSSTIYTQSMKNPFFRKWLEYGGEMPIFAVNELNISNKVRAIAEKYMERYLEQVKTRYSNFEIEDFVGKILQSIKNRLVVETSNGKIQRNPVIVFTRPLYDIETWYTYSWQEKIIEEFSKHGYFILDLGIQTANRKNLEVALTELEPVYYCHYGHGNDRTIIGQTGKKILDEKNCHILKSCQAYVVACKTLSELGKFAINEGCLAYVGYYKNYHFVTQWNVMKKEVSQLYQKLREQGHITWKDIREIKDSTKRAIIRCLEHDRDSFNFIGDGNVKVQSMSE